MSLEAFINPLHMAVSVSRIPLHPPSSSFRISRLPKPLLSRSIPTVRSSAAQSFFDVKAGKGGSSGTVELLDASYVWRGVAIYMTLAFLSSFFANFVYPAGIHIAGINADAIAHTGNALAVSEMSLKFLAPLRSGDRFVVKVSECSLNFSAYFRSKKATGIWLDKNYRPIRIPPEMRSKLVQFLRDEESN